MYYFNYFLLKVKNKMFVMNYSLLIKDTEVERSGIVVEECLLTHKRKGEVDESID